jgi:hypothetical protein
MQVRLSLGWFVGFASALVAAEPPTVPGPGEAQQKPLRRGEFVVPGPNDRAQRDENGMKKAAPGQAVPNPLNSFLAEWMTARDYALLKPGLQSSGATAASLPTSPGSEPAVSVILPVTPKREVPAAKPGENPYLEILNEPSPAVAAPPSTVATNANPAVPSPAPPVLLPPVPPTPAPAPQSKIPDFAKPATNDKYFKPLKRF